MHYLFSVCNNLRASNTFGKTATYYCVEWSFNLLAHTLNPHVLACGGVPLASRVTRDNKRSMRVDRGGVKIVRGNSCTTPFCI
jgi:hypothetical protein